MFTRPGMGRARDDPESGSSAKARPRLTAEDFNSGKISAAVFKDAVSSPVTVYPLAGALVAVGWTVMISPSIESLGVTIALLFVSGSNFLYNFVLKGEQHAVDKITAMRAQRRQEEVSDFAEVASQCTSVGFIDGAQKVEELKQAFQNLMQYLQGKTTDVAIDRWLVLADDTFKEGAQTIARALEVYKALESIDVTKLKSEVLSWQRELKKLDAAGIRAKTLQQGIEEHNTRLGLVATKQELLEQLLAHAGEIEAALQSTYLEMVDLGRRDASTILSEDGGAFNRLKTAVDAARTVEARLRGTPSAEEQARKAKYISVGGGALI